MSTITADSGQVRTEPAPIAPPASPMASKESVFKRFGPFFWFCTAWLGVITLFAIFGKLLPFADKEPDYLTGALVGGLEEGKDWKNTFSRAHPLGTDENGNDLLAGVIQGSRNSIIIAFATVILGFLMGGGLYFATKLSALVVHPLVPVHHYWYQRSRSSRARTLHQRVEDQLCAGHTVHSNVVPSCASLNHLVPRP
jgi:hypothetical protein